MKQLKLLICVFLFLNLSGILKAQNGSSCDSARTLTYVPSGTMNGIERLDNKDTRSTVWYKYQAFDRANEITVSSFYDSLLWKMQGIDVYKGNCTSLVLIGSDVLVNSSDTVLNVDIDSLVIGQTYYIALHKGSHWPCRGAMCRSSDTAYYDLRINSFPSILTNCTVCKDPCDLICNPDFESLSSTLNCNWSFMSDACSWWNGRGTPDYYNSGCSSGSGFGTPCNTMGSISPHSGNAYGGFLGTNIPTNAYPLQYEYIRADFAPMTAGVTYKVSFWVALAGKSDYTANSVGAWITNGFVNWPAGQLPCLSTLMPPTVSNSNNIAVNGSCSYNSNCWYQIAANYTATGGENHVYIGIADPNLVAHTPVAPSCGPAPTGASAYYYLDDVSIKVSNVLATYTATPSACVGQNTTFTATNPVPPGYTYTWNIPGLGTFNQQSVTGQFTTAGVYTYTLSVGSTCGAVSTATGSITINPLPTVTSTNVTVCAGQNGTLTASGASGYLWSNGATTASITVPVGSYTVTGTNANGCTNTAVGTVSSSPAFTVSITNPSPSTCSSAAAPVTLTAVTTPSIPGSTTLWSTGATTTSITVNPTSTTSYTVTVTSPGGCSVSATTTITIKPTPVVSITANTTSFCSGATIPFNLVLNATNSNGAVSNITYNWSPNSNLTCSSSGGNTCNSAVISPKPTTTTTYTTTGTAPNGCAATSTITINVYAPPTITVPPATICDGTAATLTASGASTYTWTPAAGNANANPHTTTTYTAGTYTVYVSGTNANGCTATASTTVTATPKSTTTITSSISSTCNSSNGAPCPGQQISLTATSSGATSYSWSPGGSVGQTIIISAPSVSTTYTVTPAGCANPATFFVPVSSTCSCVGTPLPATTAGGSYVLNSNTTVTTNNMMNINLSDVSIGPGVTITVQNGATLNVNGSHLKACYGMWQGIVVEPGGIVNITNGSIIEDAIIAIDNSATVTPSPAKINVNNAIFNCNRTGIKQANYKVPTNGNYSTNFFYVNDAVFTCRCNIPANATTASLTGYTGGGTVLNPTIMDYYSVANLTAATLKAPYLGNPAFEGINFTNDGPIQANAVPLQYVYNVGDNSANGKLVLFDNLVYGINSQNTSFAAVNTAYQFSQTSGKSQTGGYGINAINNNPDRYDGIYVNNSRFIELVRGIHSQNYYEIDVRSNTLFSRQVVPGTPAPNNPRGDYGMFIKTCRFARADMNTNTLANINNGIDFVIDASVGTYNGGNGELLGPVNINGNKMYDQFPGNSFTNRYLGTAIIAVNVLGVPSSTGPAAIFLPATINIKSNTLTNVYKGIYVQNQQYQEVRDESNNITLLLEPNSLGGNATPQFGIEHDNCIFQTSPSGFGNAIYNNKVTGFTTSFANPAAFEPKVGIYCRNTGNHYVTCNTVINTGRGFEFSGTNASTFWQKNQMTSCGEGYALTNSGIIGQQGSSAGASDNQWSGFSATNPETFTDMNSAPAGSILYTQTNFPPYGPVFNSSPLGTAYSYPLSTIVSSNPSSSYNCSVPPAIVVHSKGGNNGAVTAKLNQNNSVTSTTEQVALFEQIVQDSLYYPTYANENTYINKNRVYRLLRLDSVLLNSSAVLQSFYNANANSSFAQLCEIEDSLLTQNYSYARTLVNAFTPEVTVESNYKQFYSIYINCIQGIGTATDTTGLEDLAGSCPMLDGDVVFQARAFHNSMYNDFKYYEDNCSQPGGEQGASAKAEHGIAQAQPFERKLIVYPNPNTGKFYIGGFSTQKSITFEIIDLTGAVLLKQQSVIENRTAELNIQLNNGVYFMRTIDENGSAQLHKIVITN